MMSEESLRKALSLAKQALELCKPYIEDLSQENFDDEDAGIFFDDELYAAHETMKTALLEIESFS